jgi:hypothetical protein
MRFVSIFARIAFVVGVFLAGSDAMAGPVRCSVNNQDSTCVGHLTTAWQAAPTCPNQPGWTTIASAQWIGSQYSAPQCNYQAPPSCPANDVTVSGPSWTGSSWIGLACQAPAPQVPTAADELAACKSAYSQTPNAQFIAFSTFGSMHGPYTGSGLDQYNQVIQQKESIGFFANGGTAPSPSISSTNDLFWGSYASPLALYCFVQSGTTNVTALVQIYWCNGNGGATGC